MGIIKYFSFPKPLRRVLSSGGDFKAGDLDRHYTEAPPIHFEPSPLPILPIEIWRRIIAYVCRLPGALCLDPSDPFLSGSYPSVTKLEALAKSEDVSNMKLVCRAWRVIALEFAFESLVVCCHLQMTRLAATLENSKMQDAGSRGWGWWTKEIEFRNGSCSHQHDNHDADIDATRILRCTPNLMIYVNNNGWGNPLGKHTSKNILIALGEYCGASLRRLEWAASESPYWGDLQILLSQTPHLQTLCVLNVLKGKNTREPNHTHTRPLLLRNLRTLSLGPFPTPVGVKIPPWDNILSMFISSSSSITSEDQVQLPSLTSLSLTPIGIISQNSPIETFLKQYGRRLLSLRTSDLTPRDLHSLSQVSSSRLIRSLRTILTLCPNLRFLVFNPLQPIDYPLSHPSLENIAIFPPSEFAVSVPLRLYAKQIQLPLDTLFSQLCSGDFPRLKVLRLRDVGAFAFLGQTSEWLERWHTKWSEKGVRFENRHGLNFKLTFVDDMENMPDI